MICSLIVHILCIEHPLYPNSLDRKIKENMRKVNTITNIGVVSFGLRKRMSRLHFVKISAFKCKAMCNVVMEAKICGQKDRGRRNGLSFCFLLGRIAIGKKKP